jgi:hypothetical protein
MDPNQINDGVLLPKEQPIAGSNTFAVRNPLGSWPPPHGENQFSNLTDTMACVSYSATHCVESQELFLTGTVTEYSERFLAKMSGTTHQGNYQETVLATIQKYGMVEDKDWPSEIDNFTWDEYYKEIPAGVIAKGKLWLQKWGVVGKYVSESEVPNALKEAPLQVIIVKENPYHAQELIEVNTVFDTYKPYVKPLTSAHNYLEILLTSKGTTHVQLTIDKGTVFLVTGNKDKRKIGIADLNSLGLFGDEPQIPMDTSAIPEYNTIVDAKTITHK